MAVLGGSSLQLQAQQRLGLSLPCNGLASPAAEPQPWAGGRLQTSTSLTRQLEALEEGQGQGQTFEAPLGQGEDFDVHLAQGMGMAQQQEQHEAVNIEEATACAAKRARLQ